MKCSDCGERMDFEVEEKYEGLYYGPMVCPICGKRDLKSPEYL